MPDYKGRIFGRSVLDVRFRAFYGEDLFLGELLAGDDPERGRRYLFRVTDVAYGSESSDAGWAERTAGGLMAMDTGRARPPPCATSRSGSTRWPRSSPSATSTPRASTSPRASRPSSPPCPPPPTPTWPSCASGWATSRSGGCARARTPSTCRSGIRGETLPSHVGVFATTGMGKSNLMKVLAGQLLAAARPLRDAAVRPPRRVPGGRCRPADAAWPTTRGPSSGCGSTRPAPGPARPACCGCRWPS